MWQEGTSPLEVVCSSFLGFFTDFLLDTHIARLACTSKHLHSVVPSMPECSLFVSVDAWTRCLIGASRAVILAVHPSHYPGPSRSL